MKTTNYLSILLVSLLLLGCAGSTKKQTTKDKHCAVVWQDATAEAKESLLNEFIQEGGIVPGTKFINETVLYSLPTITFAMLASETKYPNTIKIDGKLVKDSFIFMSPTQADITNVDEGLIEYNQAFTSENKLGHAVKNHFKMQVKYTAECTYFQVIDFKIM